jgi:hypothetical protein
MTSPVLEWIEFGDFSPGIFNNNRFAGGVNVNSMNPCMAQETHTYRCRSLVTGGLGPLPKRKKQFSLTSGPSGSHTFNVVGLGTVGMARPDNVFATNNDHRVEVHLGIHWGDPASGGTHRFRWLRENISESPSSTTQILARNYSTALYESGSRMAYIHHARMNLENELLPGRVVSVMTWQAIPLGSGADSSTNQARISHAFPDPTSAATSSTISTKQIGNALHSYTISTTHQNRVVLGRYDIYRRGDDMSVATNANFLWTSPNVNTLGFEDPTAFAVEYDQTITDLGTMTANELLVILQYGGGFIVSGDVDDPTVISLPNIAGPDGAKWVKGCNTAIGYVYSAGDAGLYVWNGGDDAQPISTQLEGTSFTNWDTEWVDTPQGRTDRWIDLVLAPHNWVYDTQSNGWWRLEDPSVADIRMWSTAKYRGQAYGTESTYTNASPNFLHMWEYGDPATNYSWKSHPLWITNDRSMNLRELVVAVSGHGTLTFTFENERGDTVSQVFTFNHTNMRQYRTTLQLRSDNFTMRIQAQGATDKPAPLMHRCYVGYQPRTKIGPG